MQIRKGNKQEKWRNYGWRENAVEGNIDHPNVLRVACDRGRGKSSGSDLLEGEDLTGGDLYRRSERFLRVVENNENMISRVWSGEHSIGE
jgi:hypothetical protein